MSLPASAANRNNNPRLAPSPLLCLSLQSVAMLSKLGLALQEAKFYRALRWVGSFCEAVLVQADALASPCHRLHPQETMLAEIRAEWGLV